MMRLHRNESCRNATSLSLEGVGDDTNVWRPTKISAPLSPRFDTSGACIERGGEGLGVAWRTEH